MHSWERRKRLVYVQTWESVDTKYSSVSPSLKVLSSPSFVSRSWYFAPSSCVLASCDWLAFAPTSAFILKRAFHPAACVQTSLMLVRNKARKKPTQDLQMGFPCGASVLNQNWPSQSQLILVVCAAAPRRKTRLQMSRRNSANVTRPRRISIGNWHVCAEPLWGRNARFSRVFVQMWNDGALQR